MRFFQEVAVVSSDVFKVMGSSFQTLGAATEKACFQSDGEFIPDSRRSDRESMFSK